MWTNDCYAFMSIICAYLVDIYFEVSDFSVLFFKDSHLYCPYGFLFVIPFIFVANCEDNLKCSFENMMMILGIQNVIMVNNISSSCSRAILYFDYSMVITTSSLTEVLSLFEISLDSLQNFVWV